ncbi:MAG: hypothetical protein ACYDBQ_03575 [Thermoplasmatota archaeon]
MAVNPQLSPAQLAEAKKVLDEVRNRILGLAGDDPDLVFAYRRKIAKELNYDERSKPAKRRRLKQQLLKAQDGKCASCAALLPPRGSVLDRRVAKDGYTRSNVDLICRACDAQRQGTKGYT